MKHNEIYSCQIIDLTHLAELTVEEPAATNSEIADENELDLLTACGQ